MLDQALPLSLSLKQLVLLARFLGAGIRHGGRSPVQFLLLRGEEEPAIDNHNHQCRQQ